MKTIVKTVSKGLIIMIFLNLLSAYIVLSQTGGWIRNSGNEYIIQVNQLMNGSGHGMITDFDAAFKSGNNEFALGTFLQNEYPKFSGISFQYKRFITSDKSTNLYIHYSFMYHYHNFLNDKLNEAFHPSDYDKSIEYECFNTYANYTGIGVQSKACRNIYVDLKFGIGGYFSDITGDDNRNLNAMVREDNQFAFMISLGVSYHFKSKLKSRKFRGY